MKYPLLSFWLFLAVALSTTAVGVRHAAADEAAFEIQKTRTKAVVGVPAKAALTVHGKNGWHVNEQAPITVTATAQPGVDLPRPRLARADLVQSSKDAARFEIPFTAAVSGPTTITAEARFVMCQEQACKPMKETVALAVEVTNGGPSIASPAKTRAKTPKARAR